MLGGQLLRAQAVRGHDLLGQAEMGEGGGGGGLHRKNTTWINATKSIESMKPHKVGGLLVESI